MLAKGLTERGHEVTLFAHEDSNTNAHLIPWPGHGSTSKKDTFNNSVLLSRRIVDGNFDLVHSFSRIAYHDANIAVEHTQANNLPA